MKKKNCFVYFHLETIHLVHSRSNTPVVSDVKYKRRGMRRTLCKTRHKMLKVVRRESVHGKKSDYNERL